MHYLLRKYEEHTHASQRYRAGLLAFYSVIDLQLYCRFAKGYSRIPLVYSVSEQQDSPGMCIFKMYVCEAKKRSKHTLKIPHRQFEDKCQLPNNSKGTTEYIVRYNTKVKNIYSDTLISHIQWIHAVTIWT